jgi:hypothetical protein
LSLRECLFNEQLPRLVYPLSTSLVRLQLFLPFSLGVEAVVLRVVRTRLLEVAEQAQSCGALFLL